MSATTPATQPTPPAEPSGPEVPRNTGSMLRVEVHRLRSRRFVQALLVLAVAAFLVIGTIVGLTQYAKASDAALADARARIAEQVAQDRQLRETECLPQVPAGEDPESFCGPEPTADNYSLDGFLDKQPFVLADEAPDGAVGLGVAAAILAFVVAATYVGAEWSTRSMVALLFWEPRRLRVMAAKISVTALAALLIGVVAQALWLGYAEVLARTRGSVDDLPADFWPDLLAQQARSTLLVVLVALLGFGIANLIRNTGAALGVGFVYFVIVENVVRAVFPRWQEWLLSNNAAALVTQGGSTLVVDNGPSSGSGSSGVTEYRPEEIVLSNLHGALVFGVVTAAVVGVGVYLFHRRDLT